MQETTIDARQTHSLTDFVKDYEAHIAHLKETKLPEVLTIKGRAEVVVLDAESYQNMVERMRNMEEIASVRAIMRAAESAKPGEEVTEEEIERSQAVIRELMAETERLGLY